MGSELNLVVISTVQGELSAHLVKSRLESEGIPAMLKFETYFNLILAVFNPVSIAVPQKFAEEARKIVERGECDLIMTIPKNRLWTFVVLMLLSRLMVG